MVSENQSDHGQFIGGVAQRSHTCKITRGQEEPRNTMQIKLAVAEEKSGNCPHQSSPHVC